MLTDTESLLAIVELVTDHLLGDTHRPPRQHHVESDARSRKRTASGCVSTKLSAPALMDAANEPGVGFAADGDGGFILPGFLPAFDAAATFVKVLDLLGRSAARLSTVVAELPRVHIAHETVVTPWEQKGTVMRSLVEHSKDRELVLVDGVKVAARRRLGARAARP